MTNRLPSPSLKHPPQGQEEGSNPVPFSPGSQWSKVYQHRFKQIVDPRYYGHQVSLRMLRVYLLLICHINARNYVKQSQKDLADFLGISAQAFSLALRQLEEMQFLVRVGGRDKTRKIMLSPFFVGMGSKEDQQAIEGEFNRLWDEKREQQTLTANSIPGRSLATRL